MRRMLSRDPPDGGDETGHVDAAPPLDMMDVAVEVPATPLHRSDITAARDEHDGDVRVASNTDADEDEGTDREAYIVPLTAADDLDLRHANKIDVVNMLEGVHEALASFGDSGIVFPNLRDKIAYGCKRLLARWAQYAPWRGWSPPPFMQNMFRVGIFYSTIAGGAIQGSSAENALRRCADQSARRLTGMYETYGVIEGAALECLQICEMVSDEENDHLQCSEGDFRTGSTAISLALIEKLTEPGFENEVLAAIRQELPDGDWSPLASASEPKPACTPEPQAEHSGLFKKCFPPRAEPVAKPSPPPTCASVQVRG